MFDASLPTHVRVLILGGGIHGVGVLHDWVSRGYRDVHLLEKNTLGSATSSKSTKLIHGGLRYLEQVREMGMVFEALRERALLLRVAPDLVRPLELFFPILREEWISPWKIKIGLTLYDRLAGRAGLSPHRKIPLGQVKTKVPGLRVEKFSTVFSFWDGQTDDLALVYRIAASSVYWGGKISQHQQVEKITPCTGGWCVRVRSSSGAVQEIQTQYVVNCLGPWANRLLQESNLPIPYEAVNNKGSHLLCNDIGLRVGLFLPSLQGDGRIVFALPWEGYTLVGTTESLYEGNLDEVQIDTQETQYLLAVWNAYFRTPFVQADIIRTFAGLRWLPLDSKHSLSKTSREHVVGETEIGDGLLITLYGGKLTTYRSLSEKIGDRLIQHMGESQRSCTQDSKVWLQKEQTPQVPSLEYRF
jgi:glycerol-3-phosphate dehydrogenase